MTPGEQMRRFWSRFNLLALRPFWVQSFVLLWHLGSPEMSYRQQPIEVGMGDLLVVVTDGLTEVTDRRERDCRVLRGSSRCSPPMPSEQFERLFDQILGRVRTHGQQRDDQTLLRLRILEKEREVRSCDARPDMPFRVF